MSENVNQDYWQRYIRCDYRKSWTVRKHCEQILRSAVIHKWENGVTYDMLMHGLHEDIRAIVVTFHSNTVFDVIRFSILAASIFSVDECKELVNRIMRLEAEENIIDLKQTSRGTLAYKLILEWMYKKFGYDVHNKQNRGPM